MKPTFLLPFIIALASCVNSVVEEHPIYVGSYSLDGQKVESDQMVIDLSQCLSPIEFDRLPNTLRLRAPKTDSIYPVGSCMGIYQKGSCYIVDQGIFGSSGCYPGTLSKNN